MGHSQRDEFRQRLHKLAETQGWVHDVVNLNTGQLLTFPLNRPVTPLSRAQRLSQLGVRVDPSLFGGPRYRLTARVPYQASPRAGLIINDYADYPYYYNAYDEDVIIMRVSQNPVESLDGNMRFLFSVSSGTNLVTVSIPFSVAWPGRVGHIKLWNYANQSQRARIGITSNAARTIDMLFTPSHPNEVADIRMALEAGVEFITFESISFGPTLIGPRPGEAQL
jgi:hypothetical protein